MKHATYIFCLLSFLALLSGCMSSGAGLVTAETAAGAVAVGAEAYDRLKHTHPTPVPDEPPGPRMAPNTFTVAVKGPNTIYYDSTRLWLENSDYHRDIVTDFENDGGGDGDPRTDSVLHLYRDDVHRLRFQILGRFPSQINTGDGKTIVTK